MSQQQTFLNWIQSNLPQQYQSQTVHTMANGVDKFVIQGIQQVFKRFNEYNPDIEVQYRIVTGKPIIIYEALWKVRLNYFGSLKIGRTLAVFNLTNFDVKVNGISELDVKDDRLTVKERVMYFDMVKVFTDFVETAISEVVNTILNASHQPKQSQSHDDYGADPSFPQHTSAQPAQTNSVHSTPQTQTQHVMGMQSAIHNIPTQRQSVSSSMPPSMRGGSSFSPSAMSPQQSFAIPPPSQPSPQKNTVNQTPNVQNGGNDLDISQAFADDDDDDEPEHVKVSSRTKFNNRKRKLQVNIPSFGPDSQTSPN